MRIILLIWNVITGILWSVSHRKCGCQMGCLRSGFVGWVSRCVTNLLTGSLSIYWGKSGCLCAFVWLQIKFWSWNKMSRGHAGMDFTAPNLQYEGQFGEGQKLFSSPFWSSHSLYLSLPLYLPPVSKEHGCVLPLLNNSNFLFFIWRIIVALLPSLVSQNMFSFGSDGSVCTIETQCSETSHEFYSHAVRFWKLITHCYGEEKHLKKSMGIYRSEVLKDFASS